MVVLTNTMSHIMETELGEKTKLKVSLISNSYKQQKIADELLFIDT